MNSAQLSQGNSGVSDEFVDREAEMRAIEERMILCRQGRSVTKPIIIFWGAPGLGKTSLLREIAGRWKLAPHENSRQCLTALIDLDPSHTGPFWQGEQLKRVELVANLYNQLAAQIGEPQGDLEGENDDEKVESAIDHIVSWVSRSAPILLFDAVDVLALKSKDDFVWLQRCFIEQLVRRCFDQMLFVFAARSERILWQSFEVRRRVESLPLQPFDLEAVSAQVAKLKHQPPNLEVSKFIYDNSFGHPFATAIFARLENSEDLGETRRQVTERLMIGVPEELKTWIEVASVLRWINVEPLRHLGEGLDLAKRGRTGAFYLELIEKLHQNHLIYWNSDLAAYQMDPSVRRLLARNFQARDESVFRQAHQAALDYHTKHLKRYLTFLDRFLPEVAFHYTVIDRLDKSTVSRFNQWWNSFLPKCPAGKEDWEDLSRRWNNDDELRDVLTDEDYLLPIAEVHAIG